MRRDVELELRFLEGRIHTLCADLRERNQGTLRDRRLVVVQGQDSRRADNPHRASGLRSAQANVEVHRAAQAAHGQTKGTTGAVTVKLELKI